MSSAQPSRPGKSAYVSNGNATPEVLRYVLPYLSGYKIDLKTMQDKQYRKLGAVFNERAGFG